MKIITTSKGENIEFYSSASELPIDRYTAFQKYLVLESGIGSTPQAIANRYLKIKALIEEGKYKDALIENENAYKAVISATEGVQYGSMAFACLVARIGSYCADDLTEDGLLRVTELLEKSGVLQSEISNSVEESKKKIDEELKSYFPDLFDEVDSLSYYSDLKKYIIAIGDTYSSLEPSPEKIEDLKHQSNQFIIGSGVKNFNQDDPENILIDMDKRFHSLCSDMEADGSSNPYKYTVIQFYNKLSYLNKKTTVDG